MQHVITALKFVGFLAAGIAASFGLNFLLFDVEHVQTAGLGQIARLSFLEGLMFGSLAFALLTRFRGSTKTTPVKFAVAKFLAWWLGLATFLWLFVIVGTSHKLEIPRWDDLAAFLFVSLLIVGAGWGISSTRKDQAKAIDLNALRKKLAAPALAGLEDYLLADSEANFEGKIDPIIAFLIAGPAWALKQMCDNDWWNVRWKDTVEGSMNAQIVALKALRAKGYVDKQLVYDTAINVTKLLNGVDFTPEKVNELVEVIAKFTADRKAALAARPTQPAAPAQP